MTTRIFAVLSALFLVTAVGIVALTQLGTTLAWGIKAVDPGSLAWIQEHSSAWVLSWVAKPLLERPLWLVPASLGVVCAGLAATFNLSGAPTSRRRRS
jgi:hypothetical protein